MKNHTIKIKASTAVLSNSIEEFQHCGRKFNHVGGNVSLKRIN